MNRPAAMLVLLLWCPAAARSAEERSPQQVLAEAETSFARGVEHRSEPEQARAYFLAAARAYQELYDRGHRSADLCRDWGQAEYLADRLPQAVLAWRLGLRLAPTDPNLLAHLEYARDQVDYPNGDTGRPDGANWPPWLPHPDLATVVPLGLLAYTAVWALGACWLLARRPFLLVLGGVALALLGVFVAAALLLGYETAEQEAHPLVVIAREHALRRGNGDRYPAVEKIPVVRPGMEARLRFRRGDWLQIELAGGHVGWIPATAALTEDTANSD